MRRRRVVAGLLVLLVTFSATAGAVAEYRGTDVFGNTALPANKSVGGIADEYPMSAYNLDTHIDTGALGVSAVPESVASWAASQLWSISVLLAKGTTQLFTFAFGLDLLTGANGALVPVGDAVKTIYNDVLGQGWTLALISVAGIWGIWKSFVKRQHAEMMSGLAMTVALMVLALFFVLRPVETVGTVSKWTDQVSQAVLAGGSATTVDSSRKSATDRLWKTMVVQPFTVLNFGGLETCVDMTDKDDDGVPRPVSPNHPRADCRSNSVFVKRYLEVPYGSDERQEEYDAINRGAVPAGDPRFAGYQLSDRDRPAVDMQQQGGAYQRFTLALVVFIGNLGMVLLIGMLSLLIVVAQLVALVILGFAAFIFLAAIVPGRGHQVALAWVQKLLSTITVKVIYSIAIVVVMTVGTAVGGAGAQLGWFWAFALQAIYYWTVFLKRRAIVDKILYAAGGGSADGAQGGIARAARRPVQSLADISRVKDSVSGSGKKGGGGGGGGHGQQSALGGGPGGGSGGGSAGGAAGAAATVAGGPGLGGAVAASQAAAAGVGKLGDAGDEVQGEPPAGPTPGGPAGPGEVYDWDSAPAPEPMEPVEQGDGWHQPPRRPQSPAVELPAEQPVDRTREERPVGEGVGPAPSPAPGERVERQAGQDAEQPSPFPRHEGETVGQALGTGGGDFDWNYRTQRERPWHELVAEREREQSAELRVEPPARPAQED